MVVPLSCEIPRLGAVKRPALILLAYTIAVCGVTRLLLAADETPPTGVVPKRQFEPIIIAICGVGTAGFLSLRDLEKLIAERGLAVDHTTI